MKIKLYSIFLFALFFSEKSYCRDLIASDPDLKIEIKIIGTIGSLEDSNYIFGYINDIAIDSDKKVYIADGMENKIYLYDSVGTYIKTIGRRGKGPGEFVRIKCISISDTDELLVYDNMLQKLTIFDADNKYRNAKSRLFQDSFVHPKDVLSFNGYYYIFGLKSPFENYNLIHVLDSNFKQVDSFCKYDIIENENFEKRLIGSFPGMLSFNEENILYVKYYYDKKIYHYRNNKLEKIIKSPSDLIFPYRVETINDRNKAFEMQKNRKHDFMHFGQGPTFAGYNDVISAGIFLIKDKYIINFSKFRKNKNAYDLLIEIYDINGNLINSGIQKDLIWDVKCVDNNNVFYAIDNSDYSRVIKFQLNID